MLVVPTFTKRRYYSEWTLDRPCLVTRGVQQFWFSWWWIFYINIYIYIYFYVFITHIIIINVPLKKCIVRRRTTDDDGRRADDGYGRRFLNSYCFYKNIFAIQTWPGTKTKKNAADIYCYIFNVVVFYRNHESHQQYVYFQFVGPWQEFLHLFFKL